MELLKCQTFVISTGVVKLMLTTSPIWLILYVGHGFKHVYDIVTGARKKTKSPHTG